jgi:hypothetical protein
MRIRKPEPASDAALLAAFAGLVALVGTAISSIWRAIAGKEEQPPDNEPLEGRDFAEAASVLKEGRAIDETSVNVALAYVIIYRTVMIGLAVLMVMFSIATGGCLPALIVIASVVLILIANVTGMGK